VIRCDWYIIFFFFCEGVMTTPQLHYVVRCINTAGRFGQPSEDGYYNKLVAAFNQLLVRGSSV